MKVSLVIVFLCLSLINSMKIQISLDPPHVVPYVNVTKYCKKWYQQAQIPFFFQHGCTKTTAQYSTNSKGIKVNNTCLREGKYVSRIGQAIPTDDTNAKLKVTFAQTLHVSANYWIVRLSDDYSYAVVSSPNYQYLWIIADVPLLSEDTYNSIVKSLKDDQFPVDKLKKTPYQ